MATERVSVRIEADAQQATQTIEQVARALSQAGDGAQTAWPEALPPVRAKTLYSVISFSVTVAARGFFA